MDRTTALVLLAAILNDITLPDGRAATDAFLGLREVDAKVREVRHVIEGVDGLPPNMLAQFDNDPNFEISSRRVRLEALATHIKSAQRFLNAAPAVPAKKQIIAPPDVSKLTVTVPLLKESVERRWREAQKCVHIGCFTSGIIMMGSVLEALLLARFLLHPSVAYQSAKAPKDKGGKSPAIQDWTLNALVDVAVDVGWLKSDRGKFSHALRESRNAVHPWVEVSMQANFDEATCRTSWEVLRASVDDLIRSV
ncbi:hypothetical protein KK141_21350 [Dyella sp. LX-66]|uniref:hypothetical protein n=1 Tax=unclassified Dyella TaxID=2634549 RepID=UPI001BE0EAF3|nr:MULTISPECIES: hypothetical protein [unclassified Dyella]MBT2119680.1 hypothetical protein [Dyella sp. LX-1]MBT2142107.1 hypothetical protein [Dyella sp. LX-66]